MVLVNARIALFGLCCFFLLLLLSSFVFCFDDLLCPYDLNPFDDHFVAIPKKDVVDSFLLPPRYHHHHYQFDHPTLPLYKEKYLAIMPHNRDASRDSRDRDMILRSQTVPMYV